MTTSPFVVGSRILEVSSCICEVDAFIRVVGAFIRVMGPFIRFTDAPKPLVVASKPVMSAPMRAIDSLVRGGLHRVARICPRPYAVANTSHSTSAVVALH